MGKDAQPIEKHGLFTRGEDHRNDFFGTVFLDHEMLLG